ncbi:DUF2637 domain-containing protein [Micromonospora sp. NPDC005299]|uniref:DUF2637 domain-containing protein n=1 Tax=Micromonospora sp. NPDC005299 TaxID=3364231 RepID=UPI0036C437FC
MLTVAVFLSLAAQVVEADASVIGWVAAALPALGFLTMVKIALGRAEVRPSRPQCPADGTEPGPPLTVDAPVSDTRAPVPGPPLRASAVRDFATTVPAAPDQDPTVPDRRRSGPPGWDRGPKVAALVPAVRTAARALAAGGTPLSRNALARQLRADGHQLSNATASALVRVLRAETTPPASDLSPWEAP